MLSRGQSATRSLFKRITWSGRLGSGWPGQGAESKWQLAGQEQSAGRKPGFLWTNCVLSFQESGPLELAPQQKRLGCPVPQGWGVTFDLSLGILYGSALALCPEVTFLRLRMVWELQRDEHCDLFLKFPQDPARPLSCRMLTVDSLAFTPGLPVGGWEDSGGRGLWEHLGVTAPM